MPKTHGLYFRENTELSVPKYRKSRRWKFESEESIQRLSTAIGKRFIPSLLKVKGFVIQSCRSKPSEVQNECFCERWKGFSEESVPLRTYRRHGKFSTVFQVFTLMNCQQFDDT